MDRSAPQKAAVVRFQTWPTPAKAHKRKSTKAVRRTSALATVVRLTVAAVALTGISLAIFFVHSYRTYARIVDARLAHGYLISRGGIYAAPRTLRRGQKLTRDGLVAALRRAGYFEGEDGSEIWNGSFSVDPDAIEIRSQ